ncbi:MAG TPA: hypothetical protein VF054_01250 [Micromonosporaceae bacterium]
MTSTDDDMDNLLDKVFLGDERLSGGEIQRRALAEEAPADLLELLDQLPEGEYAQDEAAEALRQLAD